MYLKTVEKATEICPWLNTNVTAPRWLNTENANIFHPYWTGVLNFFYCHGQYTNRINMRYENNDVTILTCFYWHTMFGRKVWKLIRFLKPQPHKSVSVTLIRTKTEMIIFTESFQFNLLTCPCIQWWLLIT